MARRIAPPVSAAPIARTANTQPLPPFSRPEPISLKPSSVMPNGSPPSTRPPAAIRMPAGQMPVAAEAAQLDLVDRGPCREQDAGDHEQAAP